MSQIRKKKLSQTQPLLETRDSVPESLTAQICSALNYSCSNWKNERRNIVIGTSTLCLLVVMSTFMYLFFESLPIIWYYNERQAAGDNDL